MSGFRQRADGAAGSLRCAVPCADAFVCATPPHPPVLPVSGLRQTHPVYSPCQGLGLARLSRISQPARLLHSTCVSRRGHRTANPAFTMASEGQKGASEEVIARLEADVAEQGAKVPSLSHPTHPPPPPRQPPFLSLPPPTLGVRPTDPTRAAPLAPTRRHCAIALPS